MIAQLLFILLLGITGYVAWKRFRFISRNIRLGRKIKPKGPASARWSTMFRIALGQGKMFSRPFAAIMHLFVYAGFIIINIEVLEIVIDGASGTHRVFSFLGGLYNFLIGSFEILALLVLVACVTFLLRRNVARIARFHSREMTKWPRNDANIILVTEILLMTAFLIMNTADHQLQLNKASHYFHATNGIAGSFPVSSILLPAFSGFSDSALMLVERFCWWFHIIGILAFIVYITYSKHLHIILAFPNTYFSKLDPPGKFNNLESVIREVKLMLDPSADVSSLPPPNGVPQRFGAKDISDLSRKQLLNAYSCTECGRCTSVCPANITGKLLSPRKIMMDTRDRMEEVGHHIDTNKGKFTDDGKSLLHNYITEEELWACTTCNACTDACPVNIDPMSIIVDLRRFLIMEESKSPESITTMFNNIENNGAPWAMSASERANWVNEP